MSELGQLALKHGSDKWGHHWYCDKYEQHLSKFRNSKIHLLEIGIGGYEYPDRGGASLKMWRDYFTKAHIFGLDIFDKTGLDDERITTFKGSQNDADFLNQLKSKVGFLNVVIDDGSHKCFDVISSFNNIFPWLPEGAIYVIEDTETSYWEGYGGNGLWLQDPLTTMNFFKSLTDGLNWQTIPNYPKTKLNDLIRSITFYRNMIFIERGENR